MTPYNELLHFLVSPLPTIATGYTQPHERLTLAEGGGEGGKNSKLEEDQVLPCLITITIIDNRLPFINVPNEEKNIVRRPKRGNLLLEINMTRY